MAGVLLEVEGDAGRAGGVVGEILIGGMQVARGYLGDDELTRSKFFYSRFSNAAGSAEHCAAHPAGGGSAPDSEDGAPRPADGNDAFQATRWFRSGDLGRWVHVSGQEAVLQVLGRKDLQVKLRGFRIEVEEIEAVLRCSPLVCGCVVTVAGTPPRLVAWLALRLEHSLPPPSSLEEGEGPASREEESEEEKADDDHRERVRLEGECVLKEGGLVALRVLCQQRMPAHQVPSQMVAVPNLPLTNNGKIDRSALSGEPVFVLKRRHVLLHACLP